MISFLTKAKMTVAAAPFLGAVSLGVAYGDGQTFEAAGLANGNQFVYVAFDGTQMEQGQGVYTDLAHGGPSFTRAQITLSTNANNPVSLGPSTFVYATAVTDGSLDPYTTDVLRGNLAFDPTVQGLRVTGDLSNVVAGYRFGFQTATTNGDTHVEAFPNGSSRTAAFNAESDPAGINGNSAQLRIVNGVAIIENKVRGTGTAGPIQLITNAIVRAVINADGTATFSGAVSGVTATTGDTSTKFATTQFVANTLAAQAVLRAIFNNGYADWMSTLPTTPPTTVGLWWNNGGVATLTQ
jgi:hypothetical protein